MEYTTKYTKEEAIEKAEQFLTEVKSLEDKYSLTFNVSYEGSLILCYMTKEQKQHYDSIKLSWKNELTGLRQIDGIVDKRSEVLAKLTEEERKLLGIKNYVSDIDFTEKELFLIRSSFLYYHHNAFRNFDIDKDNPWDIVKARTLTETKKYFNSMFPEERYNNLPDETLEDVKNVKSKIKLTIG